MRLEGAPDDPMLRAEFEGWLSQSDGRRRAYAALQRVWGTSARLAPLTAARREAARTGRPWHRLRGRRAALAAVAIAACIAFLAVPALQLRLAADHMTGTAELRDLMLEDGSRVTLDADSAIAVDYTAGRRGVRLLSGQAYFEVTPSPARPFVVIAGGVDVTVTGTAFDVVTSSGGVAVAVQSGTVRVSRNDSEALAALSAGQSLKVANGTVSRGAVEPLDVGAWRDRRLVAYDAVLRDVVEQVGRHMPGVIVFADSAIADSRVSGIVDLRRPVEALHALVDLQQGRVTTISPYLTVISSR
jgi:transmembrane sensor